MIFRSRQCWDGSFQSSKSPWWDCHHAWRCRGLRIRWHRRCLPKIFSCHQRAFKSDEKSGKFLVVYTMPLLALLVPLNFWGLNRRIPTVCWAIFEYKTTTALNVITWSAYIVWTNSNLDTWKQSFQKLHDVLQDLQFKV